MRVIVFLIVIAGFFLAILFYLNPEPVTFRYFFNREVRISLPFLLGITFASGIVFSFILYMVKAGSEGLKALIHERKRKKESKVFENANLLIAEGNYDKALKVLKDVPPSPRRAFLEAKVLYKQGEILSAFNLLKENLDLNDIEIVNFILKTGQSCKKWTEVRRIGERAVEVHKSAPVLLYEMARIYEQMGELDKAIELLSRYLKKQSSKDGETFLAYLYYLKGKEAEESKESIKLFRTSLEFCPYFSPSLIGMVEAFLDEGNPEKGLRKVRECLETSNSYYLMKEVPMSLLKKGNPSLALEFVGAFKDEQEDGKTFIFLSILYELGMREEYEKVLNSLPEEFKEKAVFNMLSFGYSPDKVERLLLLWSCNHCGFKAEAYTVKCPFCSGIDTLNLSIR